MRKGLSIFLFLFFCFNANINAQKKPKKNWINKEEDSKSDYQYKTHFYLALKEKSSENFDESLKHFIKCTKINPSEAVAFYEAGLIYRSQNNLEKSLEYSKKAAEIEEENKWYLEFYAQNLYNSQEFFKAIKVYKKLIKNYPRNQDYYMQLADCYILLYKLKEAIKVYDNLEIQKGINPQLCIQKHRIYLDLKDFNSAIKELKKIISEYPEDKEAYVLLSDCYILNDDFDKAFEVLKKLAEIDPSSSSVHLTLADFYIKKGDTENYFKELEIVFLSSKIDVQIKIKKLIPLLQSLSEDTTLFPKTLQLCETLISVHETHAMSHYIYADLLRSNGEEERALKQYKLVVKFDKNQKEAWSELLFLELQFQNYNDMIIESEQAIELFPTNPIFYYLNALANYNISNWEESIYPLETGASFIYNNNNLSSEMYSLLGGAYNELKKFIESDNAYEKALEYSPDNVQVLNNYAYYLSLRGENLEKAKQMSMKTIEMFPKEANYFDTYAWILYKMKNYKEAKIWMQKALDISESQTFYDHMADILTELGELEEAEGYRIIAPKHEDNE